MLWLKCCTSFVAHLSSFHWLFFSSVPVLLRKNCPHWARKLELALKNWMGWWMCPARALPISFASAKGINLQKKEKKEAVKNLINSYALNFNQAPGSEKVKAWPWRRPVQLQIPMQIAPWYSNTQILEYSDTKISRHSASGAGAHLLSALDTCAISVNVQFYVMANCRWQGRRT